MPLTATAKPSRARRRAITRPSPRELPVTRATRSFTGRMPAIIACRPGLARRLIHSAEPAWADEPRLVGEHHELGPVAYVKPSHGPAHVGLGRRRADDQPRGDLLV